jgi:hypothetical protein
MSDLPLTKPSAVLAAVADCYGIPVKDLTAPGRVAKPGPAARRVTARILHDDCCWTWERVAELMNRHPIHTRRSALAADTVALAAVRVKLYNGNQPSLW